MNLPFTLLPMDSAQSGAVIRPCNISSGTTRGSNGFVEGDIKGCFDNVDHHVLVQILRRRIADEHFIGLIWKFLKAGYMENWEYHNTYSGTPQGSLISPILANIYLNELDVFMAEYAQIL